MSEITWNVSYKRCCDCKKWKLLHRFHNNKSSKDGHQAACKPCMRKRRRKYYEKNKKKEDKRSLRYYEENKEAILKKNKEWYSRNKDQRAAYQHEYIKKNPKQRIRKNVSTLLYQSLKGNKSKQLKQILPYTIEELRTHLQAQFTNEMNWDNYGTYWHIDHIIPVDAFNFRTENDIGFHKCWALSNLQPLEASANRAKSNKLTTPHQRHLAM